MAECSDIDDAALCQVADETEPALCHVADKTEPACVEVLQQLAVLKQPDNHPQPADLLDHFVSESPNENVLCDISADVVRTYSDEATGGDERGGMNGCTDSNHSKASISPSEICCNGDVSAEDAAHDPTNNNNCRIVDSCVEENPQICDTGCLPERSETVKPAAEGDFSYQIDGAASAGIVSEELKLDYEEGRGNSCDEKLTAKCSTDSDAGRNSDVKDLGSLSAENVVEECSSKPGQPPEDKKPPHLSFSSDVLLVAPTGKAANVLGRRTGIQAFTLHHVIFSYRAWRQSEHKSHVGWKFDMVRALVVDECSLVAVTTFYSLISKVLPSLQKVVLLGDILQLPSIQPGTPLLTLLTVFLHLTYVM